MPKSSGLCGYVLFISLVVAASGMAQTPAGISGSMLGSALPDAPQHQAAHPFAPETGQTPTIHRGLLSARQAIMRRSDDGTDQFNYSGIAGRAAAAALVVTYYPEPSVTGKVVGLTFATSIATDAGGNLVLEFLPSVIRNSPIMQKLRLE